MAPANGSNERRDEQRLSDDIDERRARARRNAILLGIVAAGIFVGYILLGWLSGIFPG